MEAAQQVAGTVWWLGNPQESDGGLCLTIRALSHSLKFDGRSKTLNV